MARDQVSSDWRHRRCRQSLKEGRRGRGETTSFGRAFARRGKGRVIVEERIYTLEVGKTAEYLRLYEQEGLAIQTRILGNMIGYFSSEIGELNLIVHMWGYESFEERTRRRAELMGDPGWQAYVPKVRSFILRQENRILIPAPFSPIR